MGLFDGKLLVKLAKPRNKVAILNDVVADSADKAEDYLNSLGLLSIRQVSIATGINNQGLSELTKRLERHQNNNTGLLSTDIVVVRKTVADLAGITNQYVLPKRAFKPSAIKHILQHQSLKEDMVQIPFINNNYYYSSSTNSVWGKRGKSKALKKLTPYPKDTYTLRGDDGKRYVYSIQDVKDLIAYPDIKASQLITKNEILEKYNMSKMAFNNRHIARILPFSSRHNRYNEHGKKISGWLQDDIDLAYKQYPEMFAPKRY